MGDGLRAKALRVRLWRPCLRAEIGPARQDESWLAANALASRAGRPTNAARLGSGSPAAPSLRSGKPWGQARGQVHAGLEASATAALHHALPDRGSGPGLYAPELRHRAWGRSRLGPRALSAPPASTVPRGRGPVATAGRLRDPTGCSSRWGAARARRPILGLGGTCGLRPAEPRARLLDQGALPLGTYLLAALISRFLPVSLLARRFAKRYPFVLAYQFHYIDDLYTQA